MMLGVSWDFQVLKAEAGSLKALGILMKFQACLLKKTGLY